MCIRDSFEGGKELSGAVALVVVGMALDLTGLHRQHRCRPIQSLDLVFSSTDRTIARSGGHRVGEAWGGWIKSLDPGGVSILAPGTRQLSDLSLIHISE